MEVTEVKITRVKPSNGLIGFAAVVLDNGIRLCSIAIHKKKYSSKEYRLTYPCKESGNFTFKVFYPICATLGRKIEESIFNELKKVTNENDRYNCNNSKP